MKEFADMIWTMPAGDFLFLIGGVLIWGHVVALAVVLGGRK